ncbi:MAG: hypothetical protein ACPH55_00510 [Luminiphilus sp.]
MANQTVSCFADAETGDVFVTGGGQSNNRLVMGEGDVLTVTHSLASPQSTGTLSVGAFSTNQWTSGGTMSLYRGTSGTRTVKTSPTVTTLNIPCSISGYNDGTIYISIVSSVDTTPDNFGGQFSGVTDANPSQEYLLGTIGVTGINTSVTCSVSGTANTQSRLGSTGTKSASAKTVSNGDSITIWGTASSSYNSNTTATVTIGTLTISKTISTMVDPSTGTRIPFPVSSGTISLDDVRKFFGPATAAASLGNYYFGGSYVPNISSGTPNNNGVPTSGTIDLTDFYDSCTTLYFSTAPTNKGGFADNTTSAQTITLNWNKSSDWELGYGPDMEDGVDYRITHETTQIGGNFSSGMTEYEISFGGVTRDLTVAANRSSHTFAYYNGSGTVFINLTASSTAYTEFEMFGEITLEARHKQSTSYTTSATFTYYLFFYGP